MIANNTSDTLGIAERLRRAKGRPVRSRSIASRFTPDEEVELNTAASLAGKYTAEWAREVLLEAARSQKTDGALFTEVTALRMQLNIVLRSIALGEKMTPQAYQQVLDEVRTTKHSTAQNLLKQYARPAKEQ